MLLEAPHRPHLKDSVLLTVDLTQAVADEAIANKHSIVVSYRELAVSCGHVYALLANYMQTLSFSVL